MEWFKHKTSAHSDPVVSDAWDEFGDAGYVIWFVLLEIYGQHYKSTNPQKKLDVSKAFLRRKFRKSWGKVEKVLRFYETFAKLSLEISSKRVIIGIPKFTEILSNWTGRQLVTPTESPTEAPTAKIKSKSNIKNKSKSKIKRKNRDGACPWPENFKLTEKMIQYAIERGIDQNKMDAFFSDFRDWAESKGAEYKDWNAAFRTRVNKAPEFGRQFLQDRESSKDDKWERQRKEFCK